MPRGPKGEKRPASPWLIDALAAFGAEAEDRKAGLEDEPSDDREAAYT